MILPSITGRDIQCQATDSWQRYTTLFDDIIKKCVTCKTLLDSNDPCNNTLWIILTIPGFVYKKHYFWTKTGNKSPWFNKQVCG